MIWYLVNTNFTAFDLCYFCSEYLSQLFTQISFFNGMVPTVIFNA